MSKVNDKNEKSTRKPDRDKVARGAGQKPPLIHPSKTSTLLSRTSGFTKALVLQDE